MPSFTFRWGETPTYNVFKVFAKTNGFVLTVKFHNLPGSARTTRFKVLTETEGFVKPVRRTGEHGGDPPPATFPKHRL